MNKEYICIDLKSFYASVECVERGLDPITTNLVVADSNRTEKTICLAVTPSLKKYGLSGRSRLYEVVQKVKQINNERKKKIYDRFIAKSYNEKELDNNPLLELDYIVAIPRMKYYIKYSNDIYKIYLKYFSPDDIFVYSIDEVFCDVTNYLKLYKMNSKELVTKIVLDVYKTTGITATAGIGTNLYLAKIAMDIVAKHVDANSDGVRIGMLNEELYRKTLWNHKPLTDFWRIGKGISKKLQDNDIYTMGDIARVSLQNENKLYKLFGVNAELIIDHAWGYEPSTIKDIKNYKPQSSSLSSGQILHEPYDFEKTKLIVREMAELLVLEMMEYKYVTDQITLTIDYDIENLKDLKLRKLYNGEITKDYYGRRIPKPSRGTVRLDHKTSSIKLITENLINLYIKITNPVLLIRKVNISVCNLTRCEKNDNTKIYKQFDLFSNNEKEDEIKKNEIKSEKQEIKIQQTIINLKNKYGKNAVIKGMNLEKFGTTLQRNAQIGGHKE